MNRALQILEHSVPKSVESRLGLADSSFMVNEQNSFQTLLKREFERRVRVNARYSLRAFAGALGLSSGALSEILKGQRPVSLKAALKISKALGLSNQESSKLFLALELEKRNQLRAQEQEPPASTQSLAQTRLSEDTFRIISDWYHFAILNLMDCEGFVWNATYLAKRLAITTSQARLAMELLLRAGLVERVDGKVRAAKDYVLTPDGITSQAIRSYHRQILTKAIEALELQAADQREMNGIGFAIDPKKIKQVKSEIADFLDGLANKYSNGKRHEVYFLETALFQISQGENRGIQ